MTSLLRPCLTYLDAYARWIVLFMKDAAARFVVISIFKLLHFFIKI